MKPLEEYVQKDHVPKGDQYDFDKSMPFVISIVKKLEKISERRSTLKIAIESAELD